MIRDDYWRQVEVVEAYVGSYVSLLSECCEVGEQILPFLGRGIQREFVRDLVDEVELAEYTLELNALSARKELEALVEKERLYLRQIKAWEGGLEFTNDLPNVILGLAEVIAARKAHVDRYYSQVVEMAGLGDENGHEEERCAGVLGYEEAVSLLMLGRDFGICDSRELRKAAGF